ncbi:MAG TPA: hypothetical protein PK788_12585 [Gemmatimonadaceae bacterium]|nr:hypothetical protein [Gemmatimonadaceae bacterium]
MQQKLTLYRPQTVNSESAFGERLAKRLRPLIASKYRIETKKSLLYAAPFDDEGRLELGQDAKKQPIRGGGTGFEQDLLVYEWFPNGDTSVVPRVVVELKFGAINTHDSIVYSEKARRIRQLYPYLRYGLVLGGLKAIPGRTLRLGSEFDFIAALPTPIQEPALLRLAKLLRSELAVSRSLSAVLKGKKPVAVFHRALQHRAKL